MNKLYCHKCQKTLNPDEPDSYHAWDQDAFCLDCIEQAGLTEFIGEPLEELEEEVQFGLWESLVRGFWSYLYVTGLLTLMLVGMFIIIQVAGIGGGRVPIQQFDELVTTVLMFSSSNFLFVSIVSLPLALFGSLCNRAITYRIENHILTMKSRFREMSLPLSDSHWRLRSIGVDSWGAYLPGHKLLQISMGNQHRLVLGFTEQKRLFWRRYIELLGVEKYVRQSIVSRMIRVILILLAGGLLGGLVGCLLALLSADIWISICLLTGLLNASLYLFSEWTLPRSTDDVKKTQQIIFLIMMFGLVGFFAGGVGGNKAALSNAVLNMIVLLPLVIFISKRVLTSGE